MWTYLLFNDFLFTCYGISTTNDQQTFDFDEVFEFWGFGGWGGVLTVFMNDRNEGKKVEAFYIAAVFAL
jgi:hypothetical protein